MKQKKLGTRRQYKKCWETLLKYNFADEFQIYRYLCGVRMLRKPDSDHRYTTYQTWEGYVKQKYSEAKLHHLQEFEYYLNQQKRNASVSLGLNQNFMLPVMVALITGCLVPAYIEWGEKMSVLEGISTLVLSTCFLVVYIILFVLILYFLYIGITPVYDCSDKYYFFEDYQKIIRTMIEERNASEVEKGDE